MLTVKELRGLVASLPVDKFVKQMGPFALVQRPPPAFLLSKGIKDDGSGRNSFSQAMVGLAYKVDVIEWVPYIGVRAGYYRFGDAPPLKEFPPGKAYAQGGGSIGTMLGVDYAFSRSAGIGAELDYDTLRPRGGALAASLHV